MQFILDSFSNTMIRCASNQAATNLIHRLEEEDKYIGLYQPNRYRIKRSKTMPMIILCETARVKKAIAAYVRRMIKTGNYMRIDVAPVDGDDTVKRLIFSAI